MSKIDKYPIRIIKLEKDFIQKGYIYAIYSNYDVKEICKYEPENIDKKRE